MAEVLRKEISEAPKSLISPVKKLVDSAMKIVRGGEIDSKNRQRVALANPMTHKLFEIIDVEVERTSHETKSVNSLKSGLLVYEIIVDKNGLPLKRGLSINVPRNEKEVNPASISHLRRILPEEIEKLTAELADSIQIPRNTYQIASRELVKREEENTKAKPMQQ